MKTKIKLMTIVLLTIFICPTKTMCMGRMVRLILGRVMRTGRGFNKRPTNCIDKRIIGHQKIIPMPVNAKQNIKSTKNSNQQHIDTLKQLSKTLNNLRQEIKKAHSFIKTLNSLRQKTKKAHPSNVERPKAYHDGKIDRMATHIKDNCPHPEKALLINTKKAAQPSDEKRIRKMLWEMLQ